MGGKSLKEHLEVINHKEAIVFLENLVKEDADVSEWNIKNIWYFCTQNTGGTPPKNRISQIINKIHIL